MFKCPGYYCIPWKYVCNERWDCPEGIDESFRDTCQGDRDCKNLIKCKQSNICIHFGDVCDGVQDCPLGDDEYFCSLHGRKCPNECQCLVFFIKCFKTSLQLTSLQSVFTFHNVWIQHVDLSNLFFDKHKRNNIYTVVLSNTNLKAICWLLSSISDLFLLDASSNSIEILEKLCFKNHDQLRIVQLNRNMISSIMTNSFQNVSGLLFLNLSDNPLTSFGGNTFAGLETVYLLSFLLENFQEAPQSIFSGFDVQILQTNVHYFCCIISEGTSCTSVVPWFVSCSDLLPMIGVKTVFCFVFVLAFFSNVVSTLLQRASFKLGLEKTGTFGCVVSSVNLGDITCCIPYAILFSADIYFRGRFILHENSWRSGIVCFIIFGLELNYSFISPLLLIFLSVSRIMVVVSPMDTKFKNMNFVLKGLVIIFCLGILISTVFVTAMWISSGEIPMALCSPFIDTSNSSRITKAVVWFSAATQFVAVIFILSIYISLVVSLKRSQEEMQKAMSKK